MQDLVNDWERLRLALVAYSRGGGSLRRVSRQAGVSPSTLLNWLAGPPPETIVKGAAVMEVLERDTI